MVKETAEGLRERLLFYSFLSMPISLFLSRAMLSIAIIAFCTLSFAHHRFANQLKNFFKAPLLWSVSLLFVLPLVSGLWSNDRGEWWAVVQAKLPLLLLPLAFAGSWQFSRRQWQVVALVLLALGVLTAAYSLMIYVQAAGAFNQMYLQAKLITTPLENDHVRFSWFIALAIMAGFWLGTVHPRNWWLLSALVFLVAYLHILAARTGLITFYIFLFAWLWVQVKRPWLRVLFSAALIAMPLLAWLMVPSFSNRVKYLRYDLNEVSQGRFHAGSNDGARVFSIKAGWHLLQQHPFGVGAGDVMHEQNKWFEKHFPETAQADRLRPMNEWLMYGAFAGWAGVLVVCLASLLPFAFRTDLNAWWMGLHLSVLVTFFSDMPLEVQYGIFLYAFATLWWYKWQKPAATWKRYR